MRPNFIRLLKHCVTLFCLTLLVSTCERDNPSTTNTDVSTDYTLETLSLKDFLQSDSYIEFEQNMQKLKTQQAPPKQPIASGSGVPDNNSSIEMVFSGNTVHKTYAHGITYYTVAIEQKGVTDSDYDLNLMVIEQNKRESYIIKYPKDGGNILLQPLNMGSNTHRVHNEVNEKVICKSYTKTKTVPCSCVGHTSGACTCDEGGGTKYYSTTVTVVACWDAPPEMSYNPVSFHSPYSNGGKDGSGFRGGDSTPTPTPPVYIYDGEPFCDGYGNCTPQLYWAAAQAWGSNSSANTSANRLIELLNGSDPGAFTPLTTAK